jgi:N-acyl-D-aspartate/D-glutamate deacylase
MAEQFDLVIRGGQVADGLGSPLQRADVGVKAGLILAVGERLAPGTEEIDAEGLIVTPGFVDIHTHYDGQAIWDARLASSSWNGVTTVVTGNCGVGFAPVRASDHERLIELMEGVEDIPGAVLHEGLDWQWESFDEFLAAIERRPHDIDIGAQLPHGPLRVYVMGERASRLEPATPDDIAQMRELAAAAMSAGAIGFSTSRSINHRTSRGDPTPSLRAAEDELTGIALGMRDAGHGVISLLSDFDSPDLETEFAMLRRVVERSGRPLSFSLAQKHDPRRRNHWRELLRLTAEAVADGLPIRAQVAPRSVGTLLSIQASRNPLQACPSYRAIAHLPLDERVDALSVASRRSRLISEFEKLMSENRVGMPIAFDRIFPLGTPAEYEPDQSMSLAAEAQRSGCEPAQVMYDRLVADQGRSFLYAPFANYADCNLDACGEMLADPNTVIGLGDGGAHVGFISDSSFSTFLLTHWSKQGRRGAFDLSWLIKRQTSDTARAVGLLDRGLVAPAMKADLNVIDMKRLSVGQPSMQFDLPMGGKRLVQPACGYAATIVSGRAVYVHGQETGELPGRLLRYSPTAYQGPPSV